MDTSQDYSFGIVIFGSDVMEILVQMSGFKAGEKMAWFLK